MPRQLWLLVPPAQMAGRTGAALADPQPRYALPRGRPRQLFVSHGQERLWARLKMKFLGVLRMGVVTGLGSGYTQGGCSLFVQRTERARKRV